MPDATPAFWRLTPRQQAVLMLLLSLRLITNEVIRCLLFPQLSQNAVGKMLNRLVRSGHLAKYTLLHPQKYYVLGPRGAQLLGVSTHRTEALGPQSLPWEYGVLLHAALGRRRRRRLTNEEVRVRCPWLPIREASAPHCLDLDSNLLELVRVDLGGPADHVARKCSADVRFREQHREFQRLLSEGGFGIALVTATEPKSAALRRALDHRSWPSGMRFQLTVAPQLLPLTAGRNHA